MGKLFVVGIGPGGPDGMTIAARRALEAADIVVGYTKYVELALAAVPDAAHLATPMMHEVERCCPGAFARAERRSRGTRVQR
ncbi:MAG: SAM-dependent methyltransferase [Eggerthella lenta]